MIGVFFFFVFVFFFFLGVSIMHNEKYLLTSDQSLVGTKRFDVPGKPKIEWFGSLLSNFGHRRFVFQ